MDTATAPTATALGTPVSPKWEAAWIAEVDRVESELGRRICGAHTPAWTPCKLASTHPNGRCRFHGGAPGIGAPDGNRNAWVHGLYSRRLQQCSDHCPLWQHCPMAGKDVLAIAPSERPHCVYEQHEYDTMISTFSLEKGPAGRFSEVESKEINVELELDRGTGVSPVWPGRPGSASAHPKPTDAGATPASHGRDGRATSSDSDLSLRDSVPPREPGLVERNVALFQVLLSRAQAALGVARLTDDTRARTLNYQMHSTKIAALVQAQLHIARELRQWLKLLPNFDTWRGPRSAKNRGSSAPTPPSAKPESGGLPMRMLKMLEESEGVLEEVLGVGPGEASPFTPRLSKRPPPTPA